MYLIICSEVLSKYRILTEYVLCYTFQLSIMSILYMGKCITHCTNQILAFNSSPILSPPISFHSKQSLTI